MKNLYLLLTIFLVASCGNNYRINDKAQVDAAKADTFISLVIDTLDPLYNIQWRNMETDEHFYIGSAPKGVTQITFIAQEGEYCFEGFAVYDLKIDYRNKGFCIYAEAGELNYVGDLYVRNPVTTQRSNFKRFNRLLAKELPFLCEKYIGENCDV